MPESLEALWSVEFVSNLGVVGAGVAIFEDDRVFGGDSQYYYLGTCHFHNGMVHAEIIATHYAGARSSIFGPLNQFRLILQGEAKRPVMELKGHLAENPSLTMRLRVTWRADLPPRK